MHAMLKKKKRKRKRHSLHIYCFRSLAHVLIVYCSGWNIETEQGYFTIIQLFPALTEAETSALHQCVCGLAARWFWLVATSTEERQVERAEFAIPTLRPQRQLEQRFKPNSPICHISYQLISSILLDLSFIILKLSHSIQMIIYSPMSIWSQHNSY